MAPDYESYMRFALIDDAEARPDTIAPEQRRLDVVRVLVHGIMGAQLEGNDEPAFVHFQQQSVGNYSVEQ